MAFTQLVPTLPVMTERGEGYAIAVIDYGQEHHLLWVIALDDSGEIWTIPNTQIRVQNNWTMGRMTRTSMPAKSEAKPEIQANS